MLTYTAVGIVCSTLGNLLILLALNIQKYAHTRIQKSPPPHSSYLVSPIWWLGAVVMSLGETGNFVAYGFAPVLVVLPLGIVTIILNCTIAPLMFSERVRTRDFVGAIFASLGVLLIILSSLGPGTPDSPSDVVYKVLASQEYWWYVLVLVVVALGLMMRLSKIKLASIYMVVNILLVAIFGAHTALATKCLLSLLEFLDNVWSLFLKYQTYYLLAVLILTAVCQIKFLNNSLKVEPLTKVIPVHFVFFTILVLFGLAVVFDDQQGKNTAQISLFFSGCFLTFLSVFLIARESRDEDTSEFVTVAEPQTQIPDTIFYTADEHEEDAAVDHETDRLLPESLFKHSPELFLLKSTSVALLKPIEFTAPGGYLSIPKVRYEDNDDTPTSRSYPGELASGMAEMERRKQRRFLNRSRSFSRVVEFSNSKSELVGIPGGGSVLLSTVLGLRGIGELKSNE